MGSIYSKLKKTLTILMCNPQPNVNCTAFYELKVTVIKHLKDINVDKLLRKLKYYVIFGKNTLSGKC